MIGLDPNRPTAGEMLAPTLEHPGEYLMAVGTHGIAILALNGSDWTDDELECACGVHAALGRGILVVVA